jgi:hypothetical protein
MPTTTVLWAGQQLSGQDEVGLRRFVHALRRAGNDELAEDFERFLPENADRWTDEERAAGAQAGPALHLDGTTEQ